MELLSTLMLSDGGTVVFPSVIDRLRTTVLSAKVNTPLLLQLFVGDEQLGAELMEKVAAR